MNALKKRLGVALAAGVLVLGLQAPAGASEYVLDPGAGGNRVCHSDPNLHAVAIQIRYSGQYWTSLHQGDCSTLGKTVTRIRSRAGTKATFCFYAECTGINYRLRTMAVEPSLGTALNGLSAKVLRVWIP
jgi:hypothetical protein